MEHTVRKLILLIALLAAPTTIGCGGCSDAPATWKGAKLTGCAGEDTSDIQCCGYESDSHYYTACRDTCHGDYDQGSWYEK